jgi:hypothetical protein
MQCYNYAITITCPTKAVIALITSDEVWIKQHVEEGKKPQAVINGRINSKI